MILESWAYSLAQGSDQVSSEGVRASGTRRVVVEAWGGVAAWFGLVREGVITRRAQKRAHSVYGYRVMLETNQSTLTMKLALDAYSADENVAVREWALLAPAVGIYRSIAEGAACGQGAATRMTAGAQVGKGARSQRSPCPIAIVTGRLQQIVSLIWRFK